MRDGGHLGKSRKKQPKIFPTIVASKSEANILPMPKNNNAGLNHQFHNLQKEVHRMIWDSKTLGKNNMKRVTNLEDIIQPSPILAKAPMQIRNRMDIFDSK